LGLGSDWREGGSERLVEEITLKALRNWVDWGWSYNNKARREKSEVGGWMVGWMVVGWR
jgi:hypothetical protein